jgi:uncharacterized membrane protein (DUF485 family)
VHLRDLIPALGAIFALTAVSDAGWRAITFAVVAFFVAITVVTSFASGWLAVAVFIPVGLVLRRIAQALRARPAEAR